MPDFDVKVVGLAVPALSAPVTTYRPAITVQNNGIHPANVSGICRMYRRESPGELLQTWNVYLASLAPGDTGLALADGYWTPTIEEIGQQRLFTADIVVQDDQNKTNDHLAPVTVIITAGEPPEPPIVTDHATQHEADGTDEVNVDGLSGELADDQPAKDHASKHEQGGADVMSIAGLTGLSATPQTPTEHGNERHDPAFLDAPAAAAAIAVHDEKEIVHEASTTLEHTENKGAASGYAGLNSSTKLDSVVIRDSFSVVGEAIECIENTTTVLIEESIPAGALRDKSVLRVHADASIANPAPGAPTALELNLYVQQPIDPVWRLVATWTTQAKNTNPGVTDYLTFDGIIYCYDDPPSNTKTTARSLCLRLPAIGTSGAVNGVLGNSPTRTLINDEQVDIKMELVLPNTAGLVSHISGCSTTISTN